jgi:sugar lactone lactonase YvrE
MRDDITLSASVALLADDHLGEGPVWHDRSRRLTRVDITAGAVHSWDWGSGARATLALAPPVSFALPRAAVPGGLVVGQGRSVVLLGPGGTNLRALCAVEPGRERNRFNDARCDAAGRLWAGTMSAAREPGVAGLYRVEPDGACARMIAGTTISNGLGWSADGERFLFVDSTTQRIDVLDFDLAAGTLHDRRPFARIDPADGLPDGLAVDVEDGVWIALFGGGQLRRYDRDGALDVVVPLPVANPTCPVFGGPGRDVLLVTTARHRRTAKQLAAEPLAGSVLAVRPGVCGVVTHGFGG